MASWTLLVMRHAKSSWDTDHNSDFERPLSERGLADALMMGKWLANQPFSPETILSSPAKRAYHTAQIVAESIRCSALKTEESLYLASAQQIAALAQRCGGENATLIVGHNPGMEDFVRWSCTDLGNATQSAKLMPTAAIYVVEFSRAKIESASGNFIAHQRPKFLRA